MKKALVIILTAITVFSCKKEDINEPPVLKRIKSVYEVIGNDTVPKEEYTYDQGRLSEWKRYSEGQLMATANISYEGSMVKLKWFVNDRFLQMNELDLSSGKISERRFYEIEDNTPLLNNVTSYTYHGTKLTYCIVKGVNGQTLETDEDHNYDYSENHLMKYTNYHYLDSGPAKALEIDFTYNNEILQTSISNYYNFPDTAVLIRFKKQYTFGNDRMTSIKCYDFFNGDWVYHREQNFTYDAEGYLTKSSFSDLSETLIYVYEKGSGNAALITTNPTKIYEPFPEVK